VWLIVNNQVVIIPALAWFIAQLIKVIISKVHDKRTDWSLIFAMGGMPSAHATLVCALATTVGVVDGTSSTYFAITLCLAAIVIYDAAGVRQTVSRHSVIINRILDELLKGNPTFEHRLRELIGHTKIEVLAGAILGISVALVTTRFLEYFA
jgi:acid phosphatase family membrane protein YuiD